jgi:uncharacterized protein
VITRNDILLKLKELKPTLRQEYAIREIGLFGSFSDGTFSEDSDIDLLVELEKPTGWKILSLELYLERVFNRRVDLVTKSALKEPIKDRILKQTSYV